MMLSQFHSTKARRSDALLRKNQSDLDIQFANCRIHNRQYLF